jgi:pimeloyl-ACP methyl ester carboxylesterase
VTIRRRYVDTPSGQLHLRTAGSPDREPLVLIHQTSSSSAMFEPMMRELAADFWLIAPDVPGFGQSDPPASPLTLDSYVRPVLAALRRLEIETASLFGHHSGTAVALRLEQLAPGMARRVVLSGPAVLSDEVKAMLATSVRPVEPAADGSHLAAMWRRIRDKDPDAPLALSQRETVLNLIAGQVYDKMYRALIDYDFLADAARLSCPVLVVAGDRDPLAGAVEPTVARLARGRRAMVPGAGTYICDRRAAELAELVRGFVRTEEPTR